MKGFIGQSQLQREVGDSHPNPSSWNRAHWVLLRALFAFLQETPSAKGFTAQLYQPRLPSKTSRGPDREQGPS